MLTYGWGKFPVADANYMEFAGSEKLIESSALSGRRQAAIARGSGRSYGDSAIADNIIATRYFDNFIKFDNETGTLTCEAGVTLEDILNVIVPQGWILPVVPGTKFPTVGGAIAADVHGKNHHLDGCFSNFVTDIELLTGTGKVIHCNRKRNVKIFRATCGGMGLTGVILKATLVLRQLPSTYIREKTQAASNLNEIFELFESNNDSTFSVAWLDCMAKGKTLGRSILFTGEYEQDSILEKNSRRRISIPTNAPSLLLNRYSMRSFNSLFFNVKNRSTPVKRIHYDNYFFPLDSINHWNRLYGKRGFIQYQFLFPVESAQLAMTEILQKVVDSGKGSFLSVLKKFGEANKNHLSFPTLGYTLALDFKFQKSLLPLLETLDQIVTWNGGRIYLAKDSRMSVDTFRKCYPRWEEFLEIKKSVDPDGVFCSHQAKRLELCI